jgi:5-methylcytosine-specific restriction endonuclease McrA
MPRRHNRRPVNRHKFTEPNKIPLPELYARFNGICQYKMHRIPFEEATRDHIIPQSMGGRNGHNFENVILMCRDCNVEKANQLIANVA